MLIPVHYNQIFIEFAGGMRFDSHPEISKGWLEGNRRAKRGEIPPFPHGSVADGELLEKDEVELLYIESVLDALSRAESSADLEAIRDELAQGGYIARKGGREARPNATKPKEFLSPTGFRVLVGKNNTENDLLTTKIAEKRDVWFHTKNIPGSHVIVITEGKPLDDETILFAATLAATFSKAADSDKVAVDFTEVKNVKKPNGAKPGMVIYLTNKTVFVRPNISLVN